MLILETAKVIFINVWFNKHHFRHRDNRILRKIHIDRHSVFILDIGAFEIFDFKSVCKEIIISASNGKFKVKILITEYTRIPGKREITPKITSKGLEL